MNAHELVDGNILDRLEDVGGAMILDIAEISLGRLGVALIEVSHQTREARRRRCSSFSCFARSCSSSRSP